MIPERHKSKRRNMFAETRLLMEWVAANYPGRVWHHQFRVGSDPGVLGVEFEDDAARRLARNLNRRVDMVIEPPPDLVVIEATMWHAVESVSKLESYLLLLPATPEFEAWRTAPLVPIVLTGQDDPIAALLAAQRGLRYVWWEPPWISEYYALYPNRRRNAPHVGSIVAGASRFSTPLPAFHVDDQLLSA